MWIVSQERNIVVDTKCVWENSRKIYCVEDLQLAEYNTSERALEIIEEIMNCIANGFIKENDIYKMPLE